MSRGRTLVVLHGFSGTNAHFDPVLTALRKKIGPLASHRVAVVRASIAGHHRSRALLSRLDSFDHASRISSTPAPPVGTFEEEVERFAAVIPDGAVVLAYSLGARLTLGVLATAGARITRSLLIGVENGLSEPTATQRRASDDLLAREILDDGLPSFVERWESLPLFATQAALPSSVREAHQQARLSHRAEDLAAALSAFSKGRMPRYPLNQISSEILLTAGELDTKFSELHRELAAQLPRASLLSIPGVGHDVALEAPEALIDPLLSLLV